MRKSLNRGTSPIDRQAGEERKRKKALAKRERAAAKARAKQAKRALLPLHKRPIVCPPDRVGRHLAFRLAGYICRTLVVWAASAGLVIFVSSAFALGVSNGFIALVTLAVTVLVSLALYNTVGAVVSGVCAAGLVGYLAVSGALTNLVWGIVAFYNGVLSRLHAVGYLTYIQYQVSIPVSTPTEELLALGVGVLALLVAGVFSFCLVRRVHIVPPAILATTLLVVILTFNVYTNRISSNLGIALVIVSFATVLVMAAYDKLYRVKDAGQYDTEISLFGDSDRPSLPPEYVSAQEQKRQARQARRRAGRASRKAKKEAVTVDDELTAYFGGGKAKASPKGEKKAKSPLSPAEKKAAAEKRKQIRRQVRAVRNYDRVTSRSKAAMGGFASAAVMVLCFLIIALPALAIKGNFNTIDAIDEKMSFARDYVTAVLRGDDEKLDELEYAADESNFEPHSTALEHREFTGKQIFYVESRFNTNYYLRGWIGTGYRDGAWQAVDDETLTAYRDMFDTSRSPAEELKYGFYHYLMPDLVDNPDYTGENYLTKFQSNRPYGFVSALVSVRRINSPSTLTHFPTSFKSVDGVFDYGTVTPSDLTFVNFFDGIYTGRAFEENTAAHATPTYAQIMTQAEWSENQARLIAAYNLQRETMLAAEALGTDGSGTLNLVTEERPDGTVLFSYQTRRSGKDVVWRFYHAAEDVKRENGFITVTSAGGQLTLTAMGKRVQSVAYAVPESSDLQNAVENFAERMTDAERDAYLTYLSEGDAYAQFVYDTYTGKSESEILSTLAQTIKKAAHTEERRITLVEHEDDPETPEYDPWTEEIRQWVDVPADVSLGAVRNSSAAQAYVQRDLLVRNVIDYLSQELGCTYTLTPDLSKVDAGLDGVENFLTTVKEGYCVQFASATALLLREMGIPARYVEGYIASELSGKGNAASSDYTYGGYVKDYEAHSWVEVWFDGVGWVTYETTPAPQYYNDMYGVKVGNSTIPSDPILPPLDTDVPEEPETLPPTDEGEQESDTASVVDEDNSQEIMMGGLIGVGVIALLVGIIALIAHIANSARYAEDKRQDVVSQVLESHFGQNTSESDRREMAFAMSDAVTTLLDLYGLSPQTGEFKEAYAHRLTLELSRPEGEKPREGMPDLPDLHRLLDAMAAEEFGHGMTVEEMKLLAAFYLYLRAELKSRISFPNRIYFRYVKHLI